MTSPIEQFNLRIKNQQATIKDEIKAAIVNVDYGRANFLQGVTGGLENARVILKQVLYVEADNEE